MILKTCVYVRMHIHRFPMVDTTETITIYEFGRHKKCKGRETFRKEQVIKKDIININKRRLVPPKVRKSERDNVSW